MDHRHVPHYEKLEGVLQIAHGTLRELAVRQRLDQPQLESWRWDYPAVALSWARGIANAPPLHRNIVTSAQEANGRGDEITLKTEVNAWTDDELNRRWDHHVVATWPLEAGPHLHRQLTEVHHVAYEMVSNWSLETLKNLTKLPPRPSFFNQKPKRPPHSGSNIMLPVELLSLSATHKEPEDEAFHFAEDVELGAVYEGKVIGTLPRALRVQISGGASGVLSQREFIDDFSKRVMVPKIGQVVHVRVVDIDPRGNIKLTLFDGERGERTRGR